MVLWPTEPQNLLTHADVSGGCVREGKRGADFQLIKVNLFKQHQGIKCLCCVNTDWGFLCSLGFFVVFFSFQAYVFGRRNYFKES